MSLFTKIDHNLEEILDSQVLSKLKKDDIHLWAIDRNVYNEQKNYSQYFLSEDEQNRAQKFRLRKDHDLFVIGRYIARTMLAYYSESTPENIKIIPNSSGKPASDLNLFFNISHSADQLLVGFSHTLIGVDIERENPLVDMESVGRNHFSKIEFQILMDGSIDKRLDKFFEFWTKKEALLKGIGKGLSVPMQDFNVTDLNGKVLWKLRIGESYGDWYVRGIESKQGYKSAFATQNQAVNLSCFCLYK